jgi:hypothetical protein
MWLLSQKTTMGRFIAEHLSIKEREGVDFPTSSQRRKLAHCGFERLPIRSFAHLRIVLS